MSSRLDLSPAALDDLDAAADWYNAQRPGLGDTFVTAVDSCLARIEQVPLAYPERIPDVRSALVQLRGERIEPRGLARAPRPKVAGSTASELCRRSCPGAGDLELHGDRQIKHGIGAASSVPITAHL